MKKIALLILMLLAIATSTYGTGSEPEGSTAIKTEEASFSMQPYQIIYINGPSSCGKTTLALALQDRLDQPFLHIGIDKVIGMMPNKLNDWTGQPAPLGFSWKAAIDETGHPVHEIQVGPFAKRMSKTLKEIVLTLAKMGHFLIIDDVAFGRPDVDLWREALKDYKVIWIGVTTPLEKLEQREKSRGNRMEGSSRAQYFQVHKGVTYDLEFDTSRASIEQISQAIKERVEPAKSESCPSAKQSL